MSLNEARDERAISSESAVADSISGSDVTDDEALLEEFAGIVGVQGMEYLQPFFELVTEEERLAAPIAVVE